MSWRVISMHAPGQVFIQRAAVNLLSTVLDTPEFFWSAPDIMQTLYKRICEYMELDDRVEVLNNRFAVRPPNPKHPSPSNGNAPCGPVSSVMGKLACSTPTRVSRACFESVQATRACVLRDCC